VPPEFVRVYKTWVGDHSDKIPGAKGFGEKWWEENTPAKLHSATEKFLAGDPNWFAGISAPSHVINWVNNNAGLFKSYWDIVGFLDVPEDLVTEHTIIGQPDYGKADAALKEFMQ